MELGNGNLEKSGGKDRDELGEEHPQRQANRQGKNTDEQGLQKEKRGYAPLREAQKHIGAQLLFPPLEHEVVCVEDEEGQYNRHEDGEDVHQHQRSIQYAGLLAPLQGLHNPLGLQGVEDVEDAYAEGEGEEVDRVVLQTPGDILEGQLREHPGRHLPAA